MASRLARLTGRFVRAACSVYGLLVLASVVYCAGLFGGLDHWGRSDWDQFTFRHATPRLAMLRDVQLPLWNPYVNGGNVLLAHPHCPAFSPWYLPTLLLGAPLGLRVSVLMFVIFGTTGMAALLRRFGIGSAGCFLGGVLLMLGGHFAMHITEGHLEWCLLGLVPWIMLCLVLARKRWRFTILAGLLLASAILYGSVYVVLVFAPMLVLWSVLEGIRRGSSRDPITCCAAMTVAFLLCAVVLLPRIEFLKSNPRKTSRPELVSPWALMWMFLDPGQAELYRSTRDMRNPSDEELARICREHSLETSRLQDLNTWHRLEVEAHTTSDWTDIRFEGFPYVLILDGTEKDPDLSAAELNSMPLSTEGLALRRSIEEARAAPGVTLRATVYARLPEQGGLKIVNTRGDSGTTVLVVRRKGRVVLDESNAKNVPGDAGNHLEVSIPRSAILEAGSSGRQWYQLEVTLKTTSDWADVRVFRVPYMFRVEQPPVEREGESRRALQSLAVGGRKPDDPQTVVRGVICFQCPTVDDVRVRLHSGALGESSLTLRTMQGELLDAVCMKVPDSGGENSVDYVLANKLVRSKLLSMKPAMRWRLDALGMTYDWHEYTCYVTWIGLALAAIGLVVSFARLWPLYGVGLLAGLVVLGAAGPVDLWALGKLMPMYASLQVSARFLLVVALVTAVAAGFGIDQLGRWAERYRGKKARRLLECGLALFVYVELTALGWNLFGDVFVCPPRPVAVFDTFAQRFAEEEDDVWYSTMYSAHYPYMLGNSGVLRHYENIAVKRGNIRLQDQPDYRGEAYLQDGQGKAQIDRWTMARVKVAVDVDAPDRLVLNQNYFSGWKAVRHTADNRLIRAPARANFEGLVSVVVEPGDREVELYYLPDSFLIGAVVSSFSLLVCLLLLLISDSIFKGRLARLATGIWKTCLSVACSRTFVCLVWVLALNVPFAVCHPLGPLLGEALFGGLLARSLAINLVMFILPGFPLVWLMVRRGWRPRVELLWVVAASTLVFFAVLLVARLSGNAAHASFAWNATWIVTNAALVACLFVGIPAGWDQRLRDRNVWTALAVFAVTYIMLFHGATGVVPPMEDLDYEGQGTAPSLVKRFSPRLLTDRDTTYYYAHPPLLHFYMAGSFLYFDRLDRLAVFEEGWDRAEMAEKGQLVEPAVREFCRLPNKRLVRSADGEGLSRYRIVGQEGADYLVEPALPPSSDGVHGNRVSVREFESQMLYDHYRHNPQKLETRSPNVFLAALAVAVMAWWIGQMTGRWWLAALVAMTFTTSPEMFVRSVYGGYTAINNFLLLQILLLAEVSHYRRDRFTRASFLLVGILAALANQKLVPVVAALVVWEIISRFAKRDATDLQGAQVLGKSWRKSLGEIAAAMLHPAAIGFVLGTAAFWIYAVMISPRMFYLEHIRHHLVDRVIHDNPLGYGNYPSVLGLWAELWRHTGYVLLPLGIVALALLCWPRRGSRQGVGFGWRGTSGLWAIWTLLTAVAFSLIDWRQTKHLMPLLIPLHLAPARCTTLGRAFLIAVSVLLVGLLLWNLDTLRMLSIDFSGFKVTPAW